jgi:hypothetical protein
VPPPPPARGPSGRRRPGSLCHRSDSSPCCRHSTVTAPHHSSSRCCSHSKGLKEKGRLCSIVFLLRIIRTGPVNLNCTDHDPVANVQIRIRPKRSRSDQKDPNPAKEILIRPDLDLQHSVKESAEFFPCCGMNRYFA